MEHLELLTKLKEFEKLSKDFSQKIRIGILRNYTIEGLIPYLKYYSFSSSLFPEINLGAYNNIIQEILDQNSSCTSEKDIIILSLTLDEFYGNSNRFSFDEVLIINEIELIINKLLHVTNSILVLNTFIEPFYQENGISNTIIKSSKKINNINNFLVRFSEDSASRIFIIDLNRLVRILGHSNVIDYRFLYSAKAPFKPEFYDLYAQEVIKIARALKSKNKKCLVLDCDNTLWGGIVGEDGLDNIKLDKNNYPGNIFYKFQEMVLHLHSRGVIIVLCSKNNEEDVFEVLNSHSNCLIKKHHLAAWKINWNNKVNNLKDLSHELNISLDHFVFIDDSSVECNMIREHLHEVKVIQVPEKIYQLPDLLIEEGLFDTLTITAEDKVRNELYRKDAERKESMNSFVDLNAYLRSLNMSLDIKLNEKESLPRLAQLTQKTNQFNLTTKRYTEKELLDFISNSQNFLFHLSVKDKFGDMGITGLLICRMSEKKLIIENFLMSCRILGREIEMEFINFILGLLIEENQPELIEAYYIPSKKNIQTKDFWMKFGFINKGSSDSISHYLLSPINFSYKKNDFITLNYNHGGRK